MLILNQKKLKGNLLDSLPSKKVTLCRRIRQRFVLRSLIKRVKFLRKQLIQYEDLLNDYFETVSSLSEDTPKGTFQKVGVEK